MFTRFQQHSLPHNEFIALMALMMSIVALTIDAVLPALSTIGHELGVIDPNDNQLIIGSVFLGMGFGQLIFGPWSDSVGRRRAMTLGYVVFIFGSLMALGAKDFDTLLFSRFLQGFGLAAPRVLSMAIVRDLHSGASMARVMSFVMMVFILVPMLAPIFGQSILLFANWQTIFIAILLIGLTSLLWYLVRQAETLDPEDQADLTSSRITDALKEILGNRTAMGYTLAAGIIFGPFVFYLGSAQQLFQETYELGTLFPLYFAMLAFAFGLSSFVNGKQVMKFGMRRIVRFALISISIISSAFLLLAWQMGGLPPLWMTSIYMLLTFFCVGLLFGNLNALAMEPLGHIAGIGAAVVGSVSTFLGASLSVFIGRQFNETVVPLVLGFALAGGVMLLLMRWIERENPELVDAK